MRKWAVRLCVLVLGLLVLALYPFGVLIALIGAFLDEKPLVNAMRDAGLKFAEMAHDWWAYLRDPLEKGAP